jgi:drug/metabolite transporter (DMT)-like permease
MVAPVNIDGTEPTAPGRRALYGLLLLIVVVMGLNWPIMAIGTQHIPPLWLATFRVAGALVVVIVGAAASGRLRLPPRADLPIIGSLALFRLAAVFVLVFTALEMVPAGRSSVLAWTTPLWTVPIAAVVLGEVMTGRRWVGLSLGMAGILVLVEPWAVDWGQSEVVVGHVLLILAAIINAATAVHIGSHRWTIAPLEAIPWQLAIATLVLGVIALLTIGIPEIHWTQQLVGVVVYQGVVATGIAFWAEVVVLRSLPTVSTNLTLMGVPVIGVISSAVLLGESVTLSLAVGLVLVLVGVGVNLFSGSRAAGEKVEAVPV